MEIWVLKWDIWTCRKGILFQWVLVMRMAGGCVHCNVRIFVIVGEMVKRNERFLWNYPFSQDFKSLFAFLSLFFPSEFLRRKTALKYYQKGLFVLVFLPGPKQAGNASGNTSLLALASDTPLAQPLGEVVSVSQTGAGNANPPTAAGEDAVPKPGMLCFTVLSPRQNRDWITWLCSALTLEEPWLNHNPSSFLFTHF